MQVDFKYKDERIHTAHISLPTKGRLYQFDLEDKPDLAKLTWVVESVVIIVNDEIEYAEATLKPEVSSLNEIYDDRNTSIT